MRLIASALIVFLASANGLAQTRTGTTGGTGGMSSTPSSTGFNFGSTATTGTGMSSGLGTTSSSSSFGSGFTFGNTNTTGATGMNRMGMGMGGMGMGGMGLGGMGMGGMGMGGMGMGGMGMGRGGMGGGGNMGRGGNQQQQIQVRPTVKVGFDSNLPTAQARTSAVRTTMTLLPQPERFRGVTVQVEGRKAIVTGTLAKQTDARVLRHLLLLEPGIYEVDLSALEKANASAAGPATEAVPAPAPQS